MYSHTTLSHWTKHHLFKVNLADEFLYERSPYFISSSRKVVLVTTKNSRSRVNLGHGSI